MPFEHTGGDSTDQVNTQPNLTAAQIGLLSREMYHGNFILLYTAGEDRVARNLAAKGLGYFTDFKHHYSWRRRNGYFNHFTPNERGLALMGVAGCAA